MDPRLLEQISELEFKVEVWDRDDLHVDMLVALASNAIVAKGAFQGAVRAYGDRIITLKIGARLIAKHTPG